MVKNEIPQTINNLIKFLKDVFAILKKTNFDFEELRDYTEVQESDHKIWPIEINNYIDRVIIDISISLSHLKKNIDRKLLRLFDLVIRRLENEKEITDYTKFLLFNLIHNIKFLDPIVMNDLLSVNQETPKILSSFEEFKSNYEYEIIINYLQVELFMPVYECIYVSKCEHKDFLFGETNYGEILKYSDNINKNKIKNLINIEDICYLESLIKIDKDKVFYSPTVLDYLETYKKGVITLHHLVKNYQIYDESIFRRYMRNSNDFEYTLSYTR